jgi:hypothetical protein
VAAKDYQVAVFERESPPGQAVRLTRVEVKPAGFRMWSTGVRRVYRWRICFLVGPALAFVILFMRRNLSESPQWLMTHGREREAEEAFRRIEEAAIRDGQRLEPVPDSAAIIIMPEKRYGYLVLLRVAFRQYPKRGILGATLMITQSFLWRYPVQGRLDNWTARRNYPVCGCGRLRWPQPWQGSAA